MSIDGVGILEGGEVAGDETCWEHSSRDGAAACVKFSDAHNPRLGMARDRKLRRVRVSLRVSVRIMSIFNGFEVNLSKIYIAPRIMSETPQLASK